MCSVLMLVASESVMPELGGQGGHLPPQIFGRSVNPIPTGGGQIMPTNHYWHLQIFSPSDIPEVRNHTLAGWYLTIGGSLTPGQI